MEVKAVFFDIDGTLVNDRKSVLKSTKDAIKIVKEQGVLVGVATGRGPFFVKELMDDLDLDFAVTYNGQYIFTKDKVLFTSPISKLHLRQLITYAKKEGKEIKPRKPKMTIKMEITVESTGRFINLSNFMFFVFTRQKRIFVLFYDYILIKSGLQITVMLVFQGLIVLCFLLLTSNRLDLLTVFQDLYAFHDNLIARLQAICY